MLAERTMPSVAPLTREAEPGGEGKSLDEANARLERTRRTINRIVHCHGTKCDFHAITRDVRTPSAAHNPLHDSRQALHDDREALYNDREALHDEREALYNDRKGLHDDRKGPYDDREALHDDREALHNDRKARQKVGIRVTQPGRRAARRTPGTRLLRSAGTRTAGTGHARGDAPGATAATIPTNPAPPARSVTRPSCKPPARTERHARHPQPTRSSSTFRTLAARERTARWARDSRWRADPPPPAFPLRSRPASSTPASGRSRAPRSRQWCAVPSSPDC